MPVKDFETVILEMLDRSGLHPPGTFLDPEGDPVKFVFNKNQVHQHRFYRGKRGKRHCYAVSKDTKGWYWSWDYVREKGTNRLLVKNAVRHRKKRAAISRALKRSV